MNEVVKAGCGADVGLAAAHGLSEGVVFRNVYRVECRAADGALKWTEENSNLVTTAGATDLLDKYFRGSGYTAAWYVGLYGGTGTLAVGDTAASHAGWTEVTAYTAPRPTLTLGTPAAGSVDNTASKAVFAITGTAAVKGAFVISNATQGGTTGVLFGESAFAADRAVLSGDTLTVTITLTAS